MSERKLVVYGIETSPPVRAVLLTLNALNLNYEFKEVNLMAGEHLKPEFLKKNPQHTVPVLHDSKHGGDDNDNDDDADNGVVLCDSHAICAYLVRKYANDDSLYPQDHYKRAIVDQRLHYETGVLFATCLKQITRLLFHDSASVTEIPKENIEQIHEAYALLETLLAEHLYMAGHELTIADFSIVSTVSTFHMAFAPIDAGNKKYPKLAAWLERMASLPYYAIANAKGARAFSERIKNKLPKHFDKLWQKAFADIKSSGKI